MILKKYYNNIISYNLILQCFNQINFIPKIDFINLNIGLNLNEIEKENNIIYFYFILLFITNQKPNLIKLKKNSSFLKLKKNNLIGCNIILRKNNLFNFLHKLFYLKLFKFKIISIKDNYNFKLNNFLNFLELKSEFIILQNITKMNVNIKIHSKNKKLTKILFKNINF